MERKVVAARKADDRAAVHLRYTLPTRDAHPTEEAGLLPSLSRAASFAGRRNGHPG
jgi:hypothetical protein